LVLLLMVVVVMVLLQNVLLYGCIHLAVYAYA
jgi:hypothetical protein